MSLVVDASVAVKWFVMEPLRAEAKRLVERREPLYAPDLIFAEVTNAAWKMVRRNEIDRAQAIAMVAGVGDPISRVFRRRGFATVRSNSPWRSTTRSTTACTSLVPSLPGPCS